MHLVPIPTADWAVNLCAVNDAIMLNATRVN